MDPHTLLEHTDSGQLWNGAPSDEPGFGVKEAYPRRLQDRIHQPPDLGALQRLCPHLGNGVGHHPELR
jgi:hypothetical protein